MLIFLLACADPSPSPGTTGKTNAPVLGLDARPANPSCLARARPVTETSVRFSQVYAGIILDRPVALIQPPGVRDTWWAVEQSGGIVAFAAEDDVELSSVALDISDRISAWGGNEDGLLGAAFHPDFEENGYLYVNYTAGDDDDMHSIVSRFQSNDGGLSFDPDTELELLRLDQPYTNHNGGHVLFGPDGYLYVGFGDGGSSGDPAENAQNTDVLLGKLLRLDVDAASPYGIPADNPFAPGSTGEGLGAPEIYAWGLRNPWRFSFDRDTGDLWLGDVGQNSYEEINRVERGGNYGWDELEGFACYGGGTCEGPYIDPIVAYPHDEGESVTGGVVYRGDAVPSLHGTYLYADAYFGTVWGLFYDDEGAATPEVLGALDGVVTSSFAEDQDGEVYLVDYEGTRDEGRIFRIEPAGEPEPDTFPTLLSETGCVDPDDPTQTIGAVPYGVNMPFWSDGAEKTRWIALPDGERLTVRADGRFDIPIGTVMMKWFYLDDKPIETRLMMRHDDGGWAGYTYAWNAAGTDAELLAGGRTTSFGDVDWSYPSRSQCLQCHTAVEERVLGLRAAQLAGDFTYPNGVTESQLAVLLRIGLLSDALPVDVPWPRPDDTGAPVSDRARAYLATNCSICHQPEGPGGGAMDLRYDTPLSETGTCEIVPINGDLGVTDAVIVAPGDPSRSVLLARMLALDVHRMPPIGSHVVDAQGAALIEAWIQEMSSCDAD